MIEHIDPSHGLLLAAFEARERGDTDKLELIQKLAENPEHAEQIVREAEAMATMHPENPINKPQGGADSSATFLVS